MTSKGAMKKKHKLSVVLTTEKEKEEEKKDVRTFEQFYWEVLGNAVQRAVKAREEFLEDLR